MRIFDNAIDKNTQPKTLRMKTTIELLIWKPIQTYLLDKFLNILMQGELKTKEK